jgi:hypothetical protein
MFMFKKSFGVCIVDLLSALFARIFAMILSMHFILVGFHKKAVLLFLLPFGASEIMFSACWIYVMVEFRAQRLRGTVGQTS